MTAKTSEQREIEKTQREIEKTQREIDVYERERRAARSAEVAEVAQRVWAQFASAALPIVQRAGVAYETDASEAATLADCLLDQWMNRFGPPKEDDDGQE